MGTTGAFLEEGNDAVAIALGPWFNPMLLNCSIELVPLALCFKALPGFRNYCSALERAKHCKVRKAGMLAVPVWMALVRGNKLVDLNTVNDFVR